MTDETLRRDAIRKLETTRDELRVQAHLFKMNTKDDWENLEKKWGKLEQHLASAKGAAGEAAGGVSTATSLLMDELAKGYKGIKDALKS